MKKLTNSFFSFSHLRILLIPLLISILITLVACPKKLEWFERWVEINIIGIVTDAANGSPIIGVSIELYCRVTEHIRYTQTNQEGQYSLYFNGPQCGWGFGAGWKMSATKTGYKSAFRYARHNTEEIQVINFELEPIKEPPNLISPAEGAVLDNGCDDKSNKLVWDFDWSDVRGATQYHLYVKSATAVNPVIDTEMTTSSYHHENFSYITNSNRLNWKWKVRAYADNYWTEWSDERSFDVEPLNTDCDISSKLEQLIIFFRFLNPKLSRISQFLTHNRHMGRSLPYENDMKK